MEPSESPAQEQLLSSIRRSPPKPLPPHYNVFRNARDVFWHLLDEKNDHRLRLVQDVFGVGQGRAGLSWDDIAACREQMVVAQWLSDEIEKETKAARNSATDDPDELSAEVARAVMLDTIAAPRTIYHVAALHNNIPLYELCVEKQFPGQDSRYDSTLLKHEEGGMLPWELARTVGDAIGTYAAQQYLEFVKSNQSNSASESEADDF